MRFFWGLLLGALVGGILALALFAKPLCERSVAGAGRGWLTGTFGATAGGFLGDIFDGLVAKV